MSLLIINKPVDSETSPKEKFLLNLSKRIKFLSSKGFSELSKIQKDGIDLVWKNNQFTPQEIIDALGDDAIKIFQFHGGLTEYLVGIAKVDGIDYTPALPTNAFTVKDGKITVLDEPYVP